ncbi:MAG TPA: rhomboid family intramembrane serine protease [Thermoanaerobaculia bacterium]|nr:rhomboid family intramembrane serine protease [Thermoanaerobaculia bacterium]
MLVIPLGPEDREVRRWPWVTIGIVALNVLVFVLAGPAERSAGDPQGLAARWGFVPGDPSPWSAVTAAFVHADLWHLAGNMVFLLATGPFLEDAYGRLLFPAVYLASAVSGCYADAALGGARFIPAVGASAAVFGVEGAFAVRFGTRYLRFFLAPVGFLPFLGLRVRARAAVVLLLGFLEQALLVGHGQSNIAHGGHVGGFAFGLLAAVVVWVTGLERRWVHPAIEVEIGWQQDPLLVRASAARSAGNLLHARRDVERLLARHPENADGWAMAARLALDTGDGPEAMRCAGRAVALYLRWGESDPAADVALDVLRKMRGSLTPRFGAMVASLMERRGQTPDAISLYEEVVERFPDSDAAPRAARRLAELRRVRTSVVVPGTA